MSQQHSAQQWLDGSLLHSGFNLAANQSLLKNIHHGWYASTPKEIAAGLSAVTTLDFDRATPGAALMPPRLAMGHPVPGALKDCLGEVVAELKGKYLHPAAMHLLVAVALDGDDESIRQARLDMLAPLFFETGRKVYPPTIFQVALLRPEWFPVKKAVRPDVITRNKTQDHSNGLVVALSLKSGRLQINPRYFTTHARAIPIRDCLIPERRETWAQVAEQAFLADAPMVTSQWLMGMGDKDVFWDRITAGAAAFSPFYTGGELDAILYNNLTNTLPGHYLRLGSGLTDIYPLDHDAVFSNIIDLEPLLAAPISTGNLLAIKTLITHPGSPLMIDARWAERQHSRIPMMQALGSIPNGTLFGQATGNISDAYSAALTALSNTVPMSFLQGMAGIQHRPQFLGMFNDLVRAAVSGQNKYGLREDFVSSGLAPWSPIPRSAITQRPVPAPTSELNA